MNILSKSTETTKKIGKKLGESLKKGDVIALVGDLGAGKTCITQGIMKGLSVSANKITSPTFIIMNVYKGRVPVYHFDVYRIGDMQEMVDLGYEEYFYGEGVSIVEWADKIEKLLPPDCIRIKMGVVGPKERNIKINSKKSVMNRIKI
jgi:tRNA threonylcarbamoyladenosine biosynthesis protein TsaE